MTGIELSLNCETCGNPALEWLRAEAKNGLLDEKGQELASPDFHETVAYWLEDEMDLFPEETVDSVKLYKQAISKIHFLTQRYLAQVFFRLSTSP